MLEVSDTIRLPELPEGPPVPSDGAPRWLPVTVCEDFDLSSRQVLVRYDPADAAGLSGRPTSWRTRATRRDPPPPASWSPFRPRRAPGGVQLATTDNPWWTAPSTT